VLTFDVVQDGDRGREARGGGAPLSGRVITLTSRFSVVCCVLSPVCCCV
jgi:hypothetical protein